MELMYVKKNETVTPENTITEVLYYGYYKTSNPGEIKEKEITEQAFTEAELSGLPIVESRIIIPDIIEAFEP